jgi:hypothetical protein
VLDQEIDGVGTQVPRRRAIAARGPAGQLLDVVVGADQVGLLLVPGLVGVRDVRPGVVTDLVAAFDHRGALFRPALDGEARVNQVALMARSLRKSRMRPDAIAPNSPRDKGVGVVMPRAMKPDLGVEVEGEADDVAGHASTGGCVGRRRSIILRHARP